MVVFKFELNGDDVLVMVLLVFVFVFVVVLIKLLVVGLSVFVVGGVVDWKVF